MWKKRTSLFESCLNSNSWFYLLPLSQLQYLNPIKGYKEISLSQTQAKKVKAFTLSEKQENNFFCTTLTLPEHSGTFHEVSYPHCGFSCPCELRGDLHLKVCDSQDKAALFIQLKKIKMLAFRWPPSLGSLPNMAKELDFWQNITQWVWAALIPTASSVCFPYLLVVFAHGAPWGGVAGCHTCSPYRPAPGCWLVTEGLLR